MRKIFRYECRRLLWNKFFPGMAAILLFYGWQVLRRVTLMGVSYTAPFSPWSFGDYLCRTMPLLWAGALFFLTFFTSGRAHRVSVLTEATSFPPRRYAMARCLAAMTATTLLALLVLLEAGLFYTCYFGWHDWGTLAAPALLTLAPTLLFALGSGWMLGRIRPLLLYLWMAVPFALSLLPLPQALGIWNGSFFSDQPLAIGTMDPAFTVPAAVLAAQLLLLVAGAALLTVHRRR